MKIWKNLFGKGDKIGATEIAVAPGLMLDGAVIVESGENTNGQYVKFGDGTMICTKIMSGTADISEPWGQGYTTGADNKISLGEFAVEFTETPVTQVMVERTAAKNLWLASNVSVSGKRAGLVSLLRFTPASGVNYTLHVFAIGRWK
jgi:hypothetical protein